MNNNKELTVSHKTDPATNNNTSIYGIFHTILGFFAIYLSFKCNNNMFNLGGFMFACCCPHIYIMYSLALHGGCGIFNKNKN